MNRWFVAIVFSVVVYSAPAVDVSAQSEDVRTETTCVGDPPDGDVMAEISRGQAIDTIRSTCSSIRWQDDLCVWINW